MQLKKCLILALSVLLVTACIREEFDPVQQSQSVVVGFCADGSIRTRTEINEDGKSTSWSPSDRIALWAKDESTQAYTLDNTAFKVYFRDTSTSAFFTTTLGDAMPDASYTYYATYPTPVSVSGTTATFIAPASQDGKMGGGAAIMVATPQSGKGALDIVTDREASDEVMDSNLHLGMNHKMHALRMFIPDIDTKRYYGFGEEKVQRIELTMPWDIAGTVSTDFVNPAAGITLTGNGSRTITLNLEEPIGATTANGNSYDYDYAYASIIPAPAGDASIYNGVIEAHVYSETQIARTTISLANAASTHLFEAGHITPLVLNCSDVRDRYTLHFIPGENYLGEPIQTITFYDSAGNLLYTINDVQNNMVAPGYHVLDYTFSTDEEKAPYFALAGQPITVKYESEHAIVSNSFTMPAVNTPGLKTVTLDVPYLFYQDFSTMSAFSDGHDNPSTGIDIFGDNVSDTYNSSKALAEYGLSGWSAVRVGMDNGILRICCRYESGLEIAAYYKGRIDTAPMSNLKSNAKVRVTFDCGGGSIDFGLGDAGTSWMSFGYTTNTGNNQAGGTGWIKTGQDVKIDNAVASKIDVGINASYEGNLKPYNNGNGIVVDNCSPSTRFTWAVTTSKGGSLAGNANYWLYLDNIKVQIVSE